jgi:hypothetical protein
VSSQGIGPTYVPDGSLSREGLPRTLTHVPCPNPFWQAVGAGALGGSYQHGPHADQGNRGHAPYALELLVGYAASISTTRFEAHIAAGNGASQRVAESASFREVGTIAYDDGTEMIRYARDVQRPCGT